jgi:hypothetical protein
VIGLVVCFGITLWCVNEWRSLRVVWLVANVQNLMIPFLSSVLIFRRYSSQDEMRHLLAVMENGSILD